MVAVGSLMTMVTVVAMGGLMAVMAMRVCYPDGWPLYRDQFYELEPTFGWIAILVQTVGHYHSPFRYGGDDMARLCKLESYCYVGGFLDTAPIATMYRPAS